MDWKNFLKPTKKKILILVALFLMHFIVLLLVSEVFSFGRIEGARVAFALALLLIWVLGQISLGLGLQLGSLGTVLGFIVFIVFWWLISCIVYLLASFTFKRFGKKGVILLFLLIMVIWVIFGEALLFEQYNQRDPVENCVASAGVWCVANVTGFSNIHVSAGICGHDSVMPASLLNSGEYPITLKSIKWIATGCSKSLDKYMAPGDSVDLLNEGGCAGTTGTLEVTYVRTIDGRITTVVETGKILEYTGLSYIPPSDDFAVRCIIS